MSFLEVPCGFLATSANNVRLLRKDDAEVLDRMPPTRHKTGFLQTMAPMSGGW